MFFKKYRSMLGIGAKTLLSHISLALFVAVLSGVLSYVLTTQYVRESRIDDLARKAGYISESLTHTVVDGRIKPNRRSIRVYQNLAEARLFFLESGLEKPLLWQYDALSDTDDAQQWVDIINAVDLQFFSRVLGGESLSALQQFEFAQGVVLFAGVPVRDERGAVVGGVVLAQPVDQLHRLSRAIGFMLSLVVTIAVLLAVLMSTLQTRRLVLPIQKLTRAARRMTDDATYFERIQNLPNDEIGDLGRAMNSMSARLLDVIKNLRKERDKLELVITGIGEGIIAVDRRGMVVHSNPIFLELMEIGDLDGLWEQPDEHIQALRDMLKRCMETGEPAKMEWKSDTGRALYAGASPLTDESGGILGTVCLLRDMSEAVRMEQLRRDYVANISHELRTPLTGIRGMVEPLIDGILESEEERMDSYRVILRETIRLEKLVGEMLDMSRLQDGRVSVELEPLELPGILEAAARSMRNIAEDAGVSLEVETDGTELRCMGNEDRITQVLVILMDNALSFTPSGGTVTVYARDDGEMVAVGVRDTGCGIQPKDLPMIWERFYKADRSRMRTTGTGLGLSIAKLVVTLMGGEIGVKSEPGKGADFTFTLQK
jgi:signal transduction histidine kinase